MQMGDSTPIPESATLMLGVRDLDPAEEERLDCSDIQVVKWRDGKRNQTCGSPSTGWQSTFGRSTYTSTWIP